MEVPPTDNEGWTEYGHCTYNYSMVECMWCIIWVYVLLHWVPMMYMSLALLYIMS